MFLEKIAGPPEFLNKSAGEMDAAKQNANAREGERKWRGRGGGKSGKGKKDLPAGIINLVTSVSSVYFVVNHTVLSSLFLVLKLLLLLDIDLWVIS